MTQNRKVLEQAERAEKLHAEIYGNTDKATEGNPADQSASQDQGSDEQVQQKVQTEETWEQKYRILQGKYSAEVPRMAEEIRELKDSIRSLQSAPKEPEQPALDLKSMTPEQVVEQFGEDFAAAVGSIAARIAEQQGKTIREEFAPKVEEVSKRTAQTERMEFLRDLERMVPNFKEIDVEDGFTQFLDEVDPLTGRSRRAFFAEADKQNNAARVAQFFLTYKGQSGVNPAPKADSRMDIEAMVQPSSSQKSGSAPTQRFWTQEDIRKFYRDVKRGLYSDAEASRIESDIFAASRQGRMAAA